MKHLHLLRLPSLASYPILYENFLFPQSLSFLETKLPQSPTA